ncbi:aspartate/glutamate racemase family protein [Acidaminobacter sp. JC074]|uniref:aspartate/glutamate racemase family protein n=1 Tax=Acidaminobacter sp. JC074 TaxID=2530199 RepID=UPI001F0F0B0D|nr:aspartate/glutamate racemase family protein [Acidaminobacter sp. JC074]MCH4887027.1 aspartate/glutamate racemase family protein [Acidaminobacter sp. JC074]
MKKIGVLGGMSWESSLEYYRIMNEEVKDQLGKTHSANFLMYSFDFHQVEVLQHENKWDELTDLMVDEAKNLKAAGADFIVIATNTMHLMAPAIEKETGLKVLHIAEATGQEIIKRGLKKVLLLGTKFTMEGAFYRDILEAMGIEVMIPDEEDRQRVHDIIYHELILGDIKTGSKKAYVDIIEKMALKGASGVILGCTEIPLLIQEGDVSIDVLDTTFIHAKAAVKNAIIR